MSALHILDSPVDFGYIGVSSVARMARLRGEHFGGQAKLVRLHPASQDFDETRAATGMFFDGSLSCPDGETGRRASFRS